MEKDCHAHKLNKEGVCVCVCVLLDTVRGVQLHCIFYICCYQCSCESVLNVGEQIDLIRLRHLPTRQQPTLGNFCMIASKCHVSPCISYCITLNVANMRSLTDSTDFWGPIYKISYDDLTILLR